MELINRTPLAARIDVAYLEGFEYRVGMIVAKATFSFDGHGNVSMETGDPYPIFLADKKTELGLLPRDDFPRTDNAFEVILLGAAYSPRGNPVESMRVSLQVGREKRELMVFGNREWVSAGENKVISAPQPFERLPLTYENAFGGTCEILIDRDSPVEVSNPFNKLGKGMDPESLAKELAEMLSVPEGYPVYDTRRQLPNIEDPNNLITGWTDNPEPKCWATVPLDSALQATRSVVTPEEGAGIEFSMEVREGVFHRAHPDWVIEIPPAGTEVRLKGLSPEGDILFKLPEVRVYADYILGERTGKRELAPQMLVLLPDEKRFYMVFRHVFPFVPEPEKERSMRLRIEEGWYETV